MDFGLGYTNVQRDNWWEWDYNFEFRFRVCNQLFIIHEWDQDLQYNSEGYAVNFGNPVDDFNGILFGKRDRYQYNKANNICQNKINDKSFLSLVIGDVRKICS